jgi:hypothetical protein
LKKKKKIEPCQILDKNKHHTFLHLTKKINQISKATRTLKFSTKHIIEKEKQNKKNKTLNHVKYSINKHHTFVHLTKIINQISQEQLREGN